MARAGPRRAAPVDSIGGRGVGCSDWLVCARSKGRASKGGGGGKIADGGRGREGTSVCTCAGLSRNKTFFRNASLFFPLLQCNFIIISLYFFLLFISPCFESVFTHLDLLCWLLI
jgi:hypothetical protein